MTSIKNATVNSSTSNFASMANARFARPLPFGTSWTSIRIAIRYCLTDSGANAAPVFAMGVCSGSSAIFGDASVTNFVGLVNNGTTWTRDGTNGLYTAGTWICAKKVGSTLTAGSGSMFDGASNGNYYNRRVAMCIDITKGSPTYSLRGGYCNNLSTATEPSLTTFRAGVEGSFAFTSHGLQGVSRTVTTDEVAGSYDHVNLSWSLTAVTLDIDDLYIVRTS